MLQRTVLRFGGEFRDPAQESAFQAARLPETLRLCRLLFLLSAGLNALFLLSDWRFHGTPHFFVAVPARLFVVLASLACLALVLRAKTFGQAQAVAICWEVAVTIGVAFLVSSRSDLALFVVMLLPAIFYLVTPTSFRVTLASGLGCSLSMLVGYLGAGAYPTTTLGLVLVVLVLNTALALAVTHANRLRRLEWQATQAEREAKEALVESRALIERMFMAVPIPLVLAWVGDGRFLRANDAALRFLGRPGVRDLDGDRIGDFVDPRDRRAFLAALDHGDRIDSFEAVVHDGAGASRDVVVTATSLPIDQKRAIVAGIVDITERKAAERKSHWQATHDGLTALPNRLLFQERLQQALADMGQAGTVCLFLIDLDDFKSVNDTLGHDAGDTLLVEAAARLRAVLSPGDLLARLGGDEFVVLSCRPLGVREALAEAEALLDVLRLPFARTGHAVSTRASLGIAMAPLHHGEPAELLKDADLSLYRAKAGGRNRAVVYEPSMRADMLARVAICHDLSQALLAGQIVPFYQPQIDLGTGAVDGFEALARWLHPERGVLTAGAFALGLEDPETSRAIDAAILSQVIADLRAWREAGLAVPRIWVNLAPSAFRDDQMPQRLLDELAEAGVPPRLLGVEVTETVLLRRHGDEVERALHALRAAGVQVALDDFGTGYASLTHLRRFPVDLIKLDRSFVRDLAQEGADAAIVRAVLSLARDLGIDVIAEGVETAAQEAFLNAHGCRFAQGFRYARPAPASRVPWLASQASLIPPASDADAGQDGVAAA